MQDGRLLAMTILFFAAIAILAPLAFFAGLERGRGGLSAQAAELSQEETVSGLLPPAGHHHSGAGTICGDEEPISQALARILCGATQPDQAPLMIANAPARAPSEALSRSFVASIADLDNPQTGAPFGLAMAPDAATPAGQRAGQAAFWAAGFQDGNELPGSLTPFILTSPSVSPPPPSAPLPGPTAPPPGAAPPTDPPMMQPPAMVVPLPAAISLFCGGLAFILALARRKQPVAGGQ